MYFYSVRLRSTIHCFVLKAHSWWYVDIRTIPRNTIRVSFVVRDVRPVRLVKREHIIAAGSVRSSSDSQAGAGQTRIPLNHETRSSVYRCILGCERHVVGSDQLIVHILRIKVFGVAQSY